MKTVEPERRERRALRALFEGDPQRAEANARALLEAIPSSASGWAAIRGALTAQGRPADAAALRELVSIPDPEVAEVIDRIAGRWLSRAGLIFDPGERFRVRAMAEVLDEVVSAEALRAGDDVVWFEDRGGALVERSPVVDLGGAAEPGLTVRYRTAPKFVASICNAAVVGEGLVLTADGEFIDDIHPPAKPLKYGALRRGDELTFKAPAKAHGQLKVKVFDTPAFLMAGPTDTSFGDFLINFANRLALYEAAGLDCPILLRWKPLRQVLPIMEALGVGPERLVFHTTDQISVFPKLFASCWPSRDKAAPVAGVFDIYRRTRAESGAPGARLYLDRRSIRKRSLVNEDEVCRLFAARGFQIVDPGALTFEEVRRLFAAPACVAGPYGSAFHNLVFSNSHPINLVLMPRHRDFYLAEFAQWQVDCGNRFAFVMGDELPEDHTTRTPWSISLDKVERALDGLMHQIALGDTAEAC